MSDSGDDQVLDGRLARTRQAATLVGSELVEPFLRRAESEDARPRVLIDGHCNVLWSSPGAERRLQPPLPLWIKAGRLHADGPTGAKTWPSFVEDLGSEPDRLLLSGESADVWVLVRGWAKRHDNHRLVFLDCALSWPLRSVESSGLAADFGLTRTECAVLDAFARLAKPTRIAEQLQVSVSTVRSHLKQIHTKMSVNSSVQLLQITRAYCDR